MKRLIRRALGRVLSQNSLRLLGELITSVRRDLKRERGGMRRVRENFEHPYKLHIGCGGNKKDGWVNIDMAGEVDLRLDVREGLPFDDGSVSMIYCEHFLEHLEYPSESMPLLRECCRVLAPGSAMHVGVPDSRQVVEACLGDPVDPEFLRKARENDWGYPESCQTGFEFINYHFRAGGEHKFAFDAATLRRQLVEAGMERANERAFDPQLDSAARREGSLYVVARKAAAEDEEDLPEIRIAIRLEGDGFASPEEFALRRAIEADIEKAGIGEVVDAGSGMGEMNIAVATAHPECALERVQEIIAKHNLSDRVNLKICP